MSSTRAALVRTQAVSPESIVERTSGSPFAAELRRLVLDPAGLTDTHLEIAETRQGGFGGLSVRGYDEDTDVTEIDDALGRADGGLVSTARDVDRFLRALLKEKTLLKPRSLRAMKTIVPEEDYGLGLERFASPWGEIQGHSGATAGFQSLMYYLPDKDLSFVALTNSFDAELGEQLLEETLATLD